MFNIGDRVCLSVDKKQIGVVMEVLASDNSKRYKVFHSATKVETYFENQLEAVTENNTTFLSLPNFLGCYAALKMGIASPTTMFALNAGNIKFIPFQFRPLSRILNSEFPRILIADEVGVGKTIETGIILKEFEKRDTVKSVIIICPKDLTSKWKREMKNRFDEAFEILTSERLNYCLKELEMEGEWPFECQKCIVGLEMLRREENINRLYAIDDVALFDMLVLDEAHHAINSNSNSHRAIEYFCENSEVAIFLSATPLQLGSTDLFSLLNMLLPEEFMDEAVFDDMAEPNRYINEAIYQIRKTSDITWQKNAVDALGKIYVNDWARQSFKNNQMLNFWVNRLSDFDNPLSDEERISCLRDLESLHTFSHVINRTKRKDIGEFTLREPITVMTEYSESEQAFYDAARDFKRSTLIKRYGPLTANLIMSTIERQLTSSLPAFVQILDQFIERGLLSVAELSDDIMDDYAIDIYGEDFYDYAMDLKELAKSLPATDSKTEKLLEIAHDTVNNTDAGKLLVFSFFKNTLRYLYENISNTNIRVATITGDTDADERDELRNRFRLNKEDPNAIDVLLCSEVGCEGLDYEFCTRMVNYDIPWNPMKIEQRIGRIDRFGQKSPKIQIFNFITNGTIEERIFYRCFERLGIFNSTIGDLEGVLGDISTELTQAAFDLSLTEEQQSARSQQLVDNAIRLVMEQRKFESEAKDLFLMDVEATEANLTEERFLQIQWQKKLIETFIKNLCTEATCTEVSDTQLKIRLFKNDKQTLFSRVNDFKRRRKIDRNSQQLHLLEEYLTSDNQICVLEFDSTKVDTEEKTMLVSTSHPLFVIANADSNGSKEMVYSNMQITDCKTLPVGNYTFSVYQWQEYGYRKSDDIKVLICNSETNEIIDISNSEFESLLLSAKNSENIKELNIDVLNDAISLHRDIEKERLTNINEDIINRKLSTLRKYFSNQIEKAEARKNQAQDKKIFTLYSARIMKLKAAWEEKERILKENMQADIIIKLRMSGTIEVK